MFGLLLILAKNIGESGSRLRFLKMIDTVLPYADFYLKAPKEILLMFFQMTQELLGKKILKWTN